MPGRMITPLAGRFHVAVRLATMQRSLSRDRVGAGLQSPQPLDPGLRRARAGFGYEASGTSISERLASTGRMPIMQWVAFSRASCLASFCLPAPSGLPTRRSFHMPTPIGLVGYRNVNRVTLLPADCSALSSISPSDTAWGARVRPVAGAVVASSPSRPSPPVRPGPGHGPAGHGRWLGAPAEHVCDRKRQFKNGNRRA